jgi:uncharacterized protein (TIGR03437 family)
MQAETDESALQPSINYKREDPMKERLRSAAILSRAMLQAVLILLWSVSAFAQGVVTTVAGTGEAGFSGDGGLATAAQMNFPGSVAVDRNTNLYIADLNNQRIRKVTANGTISTIAGTGTPGFSGDGGPATEARLQLNAGIWTQFTAGVAVDMVGNVYIADSYNHRVRRVGLDGVIRTVAGNGISGQAGDGGLATDASLNHPGGVAVDSLGNIFIADTGNGAIRKVGMDGTITTLLRGFGAPSGVAVDVVGNVYVADEDSVFKSDLGGNTTRLGSGWNVPWALVVDEAGDVYVADSHAHRIRKISPDGSAISIPGTGLTFPLGVALDSAGNLYIADAGNNRIQRVSNSDIERRIPTFSDDSITSAASFVPGSGLVPGGLITIFGTNLTNVSGIVTAGDTPLPTELSGTQVSFVNTNGDGAAGPGRILAVANINGLEQISVQVPNGILGDACYTSAPDGCGISVVVINNGISSSPVVMGSPISSPGVFTVDGTTGVIIHSSTNQLVTVSAPAARGEVVSIYATGLGPIFKPDAPPDGAPAPADPPISAPDVAVIIDGQRARMLRSILAPGLVGVNQVDVEIPAGVSSGSVNVYLQALGFVCVDGGPECSYWRSNTAKIWVQ